MIPASLSDPRHVLYTEITRCLTESSRELSEWTNGRINHEKEKEKEKEKKIYWIGGNYGLKPKRGRMIIIMS